MAEQKKNPITVQKVAKNYDKGLAVFGGLAIGKMMSHFLDKAITSPTVKGLVGVEVSENMKKYVKPLIITGAGLTAFVASTNSHIKYAGIGCAGIGMSELVNAVTGKDYLAGLGGEDSIDYQDEDDYEMIDIESGEAIPPAPALDFPELEGMTFGADVSLDNPNYAEEEEDDQEDYVEVVNDNEDDDDFNPELDA